MSKITKFRLTIAATLAASVMLCFAMTLAAQQKPAPDADEAFKEAEALLDQGRFNEAKSVTLHELQRHPSNVEGYNLLGIIATDQQDYTSAIAAFKKALQISPNSAKTHVNLGNVYTAQKELGQAESEFKTVLRIDPANCDANYNLGILLMMKGQPAAAIPHFERVRPANLATRFNLIRAYFECKRTQDALRMASELSSASGD